MCWEWSPIKLWCTSQVCRVKCGGNLNILICFYAIPDRSGSSPCGTNSQSVCNLNPFIENMFTTLSISCLAMLYVINILVGMQHNTGGLWIYVGRNSTSHICNTIGAFDNCEEGHNITQLFLKWGVIWYLSWGGLNIIHLLIKWGIIWYVLGRGWEITPGHFIVNAAVIPFNFQ